MGEENKMPAHVAVIMDGNGRWAEKRGLPRVAGHRQGALTVKEILKKADEMGIKYLTVYAFSTENWKRSEEEVSGIFNLLVKFVNAELDDFNRHNARVRVIGDFKRKIPETARESIEKALKQTEKNTGIEFIIALNYGSRAEIVRAVQKIADIVSDGAMSPDDISENMITNFLYTGEENGRIPDPDIIIRTSGEERLSNFMMWQAAYSELAFTDTLWPDFTPDEFEKIVYEVSHRERRYGGRNK